jgi:hypothetical protein
MTGKIITVIIGLLVSAAGFYLLVKWWDGNAWQRFLSGAMALGGLGAVWAVIKGEPKATPTVQNKDTATTPDHPSKNPKP